MMQTILVGIAAGIAAALMFLAPIGGTVLAFPLFILTGLPIGLAGLGWGVRAGAVAVFAGTLAIFFALSSVAAAAFLLLFAAPAFWVAGSPSGHVRVPRPRRPANGIRSAACWCISRLRLPSAW